MSLVMLELHQDTGGSDLEQEADLFELANLFPGTTGLPMTVWVSPRGGARHDARVKVCTTPGNPMDIAHTAVVSVCPRAELLHGDLSAKDLAAVQGWIALNAAALIDYWNGQIDTIQFGQRLRKA
jgi:hypothetical protein